MANTYTQLLLQFVFAVQDRKSLIKEPIRERVEKYMCGCINKLKYKPLAIYCMPDHTHVLVGQNPAISLSDFVKELKTSTTLFIKKEKLLSYNFSWQEGYGAFSYSKSQLDSVVRYILSQSQHHTSKSFKEEYLEFLEKFDVSFDERYLFNWI